MDKKFVNVYLYLFDSQYVVNKYKKEEDVSFQMRPLRLVIRLGLEPKTPTLKVLCSTC